MTFASLDHVHVSNSDSHQHHLLKCKLRFWMLWWWWYVHVCTGMATGKFLIIRLDMPHSAVYYVYRHHHLEDVDQCELLLHQSPHHCTNWHMLSMATLR